MSSAPSASSGSSTPNAQTTPPAQPAPPEGSPREIDLEQVKPYADHLGDGIVQFSFTLPVPYGLAARKAAQELATKMGF